MIAGRFNENPDYVAYERHLLRLQELSAERRDESEEANSIRDQMDAPWLGLSREEREWLGGLSADLYMLSDEEVPEKADPEQRGPDTLGISLLDAQRRGDSAQILKLLRKGPAFFPKTTIAYLRGLAYRRLGHPQVALLFFDYAAKLAPLDDHYPSLSLDVLRQLGRHDEALARAKRHIADPSAGLDLVVHSLSEVFRSTQSVSEDDARPIYEELIALLDDKLRQFDQTHGEDPETVAFGYLLLGACLESIGRYEQALDAYDSSSEIDPLVQHASIAKSALLENMRAAQPSAASLGQHRENRFKIVLNAERMPGAA